MTLNQAGLDLIKSFEGCRLEAYRDCVGVLTVGYGHTGEDVTEGLIIDQDTANRLLERDLDKFCDGVFELVKVTLNPNQFSALVSFAYNLGLGSLKSSTLLKKVNSDDMEGAAAEFPRWDRAGRVEVAGLLRRREAEQTLFKA